MPHPPQPAYPYAPAQPTNGFAVTALVLGIAGFCSYGLLSIGAIIFGIIARQQCRERNERGEGMAVAGIILGSVMLGLGLLYLIFMLTIFGGFGMFP